MHDIVRGSLNHRSPCITSTGLVFGPTATKGTRETNVRPNPIAIRSRLVFGRHCVTPRQTCPQPKRLWAQLAFKNSMVHGILQFTPRIAFRYVLHRCKSRDIRCRESFCLQLKGTRPRRIRHVRDGEEFLTFTMVPWHNPRQDWFVVLRGAKGQAGNGRPSNDNGVFPTR